MALNLITPPAVEPVTVSDMHTFLRLDGFTDDDALLTSLITAARGWCEDYTQRRFINQQWQLNQDFFPGQIWRNGIDDRFYTPVVVGPTAVFAGYQYAIRLPYPPLVSVDSFTYQDGNGNVQTMVENVNYTKDLLTQPARLIPPFGQLWPIARVIANAVTIQFTCGYGTAATDVAENIKTAIKLLVAHWYENRVPDDNDIPAAVKSVLSSYRDLRV